MRGPAECFALHFVFMLTTGVVLQFNCISLGLTLGAIAGVLSRNELVAAALFTLAINHKQVALCLENYVHSVIHKLCYHTCTIKHETSSRMPF